MHLVDFVADTILVVLPLHLLWGITIRHNQNRLLVVIFSASLLTFIVSIIHARFVFSTKRNAAGLLAHLEVCSLWNIIESLEIIDLLFSSSQASTALVVCNLAVLVSWIRRAWFHGDDMDVTPPGSTGGMFSSDRRQNTDGGGTQISALRFGEDTTVMLSEMQETLKSDNNSRLSSDQDKGVP